MERSFELGKLTTKRLWAGQIAPTISTPIEPWPGGLPARPVGLCGKTTDLAYP